MGGHKEAIFRSAGIHGFGNSVPDERRDCLPGREKTMNKISRTLILSVAALATVATSVEFAAAGDRHWRKHHGRHWNKHAVIAGVTAGVVVGGLIASRPRVVYRDAPVIIDEEPIYEDRDMVYIDPEEEYERSLYRDRLPDDDYAAADGNYEELQGRGYDDEGQANGSDYFPEPPRRQSERRDSEGSRDYADAGRLEPWTEQWRRYCADRYQSFNPNNGTYLGYDQKRHFCKAG